MSCSKTVACKRENIAGINVLQTLRKFGFGELQLEQMVDVCWKKILGLVLSSFKGSAGCDHLRVIMSAKIDWWMEQPPFVLIKIPSEKGFQAGQISPLDPLFLSLRQGVNEYQLLHLLRQVVGRGVCNVKRFSWLQLSIIQLFLDASKDICREKISTWIATELCLSSPWKDAQSKICSNECKKKRQQVAKKEKSTCRSFLSRPLHLWPFHSLCQSLPKKTNATMTAGQGKCWSPPPQYAIASHFKVLALDTLFDALGPCLVASKTMWLWHSRRLFCKKYLVVAMLEVGAAKKGKTLVSYYEQRKLKLS